MITTTRIEGGIEFFTIEGHGQDEMCARCGSSAMHVACLNCGGDGYSHHDCGEDCCCCLYPEDNVVCDGCGGQGGSFHCLSRREWCEAHPMPGREAIKSTAMSSEAWSEV